MCACHNIHNYSMTKSTVFSSLSFNNNIKKLLIWRKLPKDLTLGTPLISWLNYDSLFTDWPMFLVN